MGKDARFLGRSPQKVLISRMPSGKLGVQVTGLNNVTASQQLQHEDLSCELLLPGSEHVLRSAAILYRDKEGVQGETMQVDLPAGTRKLVVRVGSATDAGLLGKGEISLEDVFANDTDQATVQLEDESHQPSGRLDVKLRFFHGRAGYGTGVCTTGTVKHVKHTPCTSSAHAQALVDAAQG